MALILIINAIKRIIAFIIIIIIIMSDCLNKDVKVSSAVYCEDPETGEPDPETAMFSWMAVRAAGPNVLKDTTLCGETTIYNPKFPNGLIGLCAKPIWPCIQMNFTGGVGYLAGINETANTPAGQWGIINTAKINGFQMTVTQSDDISNPLYDSVSQPILSFTGTDPSIKSFQVQNTSGQDLLVRATLYVSYNQSSGQQLILSFGTGDPDPESGLIGEPQYAPAQLIGLVYNFEMVRILTLPAGAFLAPYWQCVSSTNEVTWNQVNLAVEVIGCDTGTSSQEYNIPGVA